MSIGASFAPEQHEEFTAALIAGDRARAGAVVR